MSGLFAGLGLIAVSSLANGVFSLPLRLRRRYAVENMWVLVFPLGYFGISQLAAIVLVPGWWDAIQAAGPGTVWLTIVFGAGWGIASVLFSQAIPRVGVSLGYAVIMGIIMAVGSMIPLARHWAAVPAGGRVLSLAGVAMGLVGVAVSAWSGILRERPAAPAPNDDAPVKGTMVTGLIFCVLSGVLSACSNVGFEYAEPVARAFDGTGTHPVLASLVRWLPLYWGGSAMVVLASSWQLTWNGTWSRYRGAGAARDLRLSLLMAVLISLTQVPYGMGAYYLGELGTSLGFAMSMALSLLIANLTGVLAGEWRGAPRAATRTLLVGLACLIVAIILLAWASRLTA